MSTLRQVLLGILVACIFLGIIMGSMALALAEGGVGLAIAFTPTQIVDTPRPGEPTFTPLPTNTLLPNEASQEEACPSPEGWRKVDTFPGDTIESLAEAYNVDVAELMRANCLKSGKIIPNSIIAVPPSPPTPTPVTPSATTTSEPAAKPKPTKSAAQACGSPAGWTSYTVKKGDTLYSIARAYYTDVQTLKAANCLSGDLIRGGQQLYVPKVATRVPTKSAAPTLAPPTATSPPPPTATEIPTNTPVTPPPTPTFTPISGNNPPTPTDTPAPSSEGNDLANPSPTLPT